MLVVGIGTGGYLYYNKQKMLQAAELARIEAARLKAEKEEAERLRKEAEELKRKEQEALRLAEEERLRKEKEKEKQEEERRRLAEEERLRKEEEERRRLAAMNQKEDDQVEAPKEKDPRIKIYDKGIVLAGVDSRSKKNQDLWNEKIKVLCETNSLEDFRKSLEPPIIREIKRSTSLNEFKVDNYYNAPMFRHAIALYNLLGKVSDETIDKLRGKESSLPEGETFLHYLLSNKDNSLVNFQYCLAGRETEEDIIRILGQWKELWDASSPEFRDKYQSVAIACSLIRPDKREGCRVKGQQKMTVKEIYEAFCESNEGNRLKTNIASMSPLDLIYVVNIGVPRSEMEWAQTKVRLSRKQWGKAYPMIRYRMDKAKQGVNPYTDYSFADILKEGGVCADQGYFAANTARCNGIPAAYVTGDGNLGPHAWFIYMDTESSWSSAGRYASYTTGTTINPQTGERVHESLLEMRSEKTSSREKMEKTQDLIMLYDLFKSFDMNAAATKLLVLARENTPTEPLPWTITIKDMENNPRIKVEQWAELSATLRKKFQKRPDFLEMADYIDEKFVRPNKDKNSIAKDLARERSTLKRKNEDRIDLAMQALKRQTDHLIEAEKLDEADRIFKKAMKDYSKRLDAMKSVLKIYNEFASAHEQYLPKALQAMERNYKSNIETKATFYFTVKQEAAILQQIAGYYRAAGNEKKAGKLQKDADARVEAATNG